MNERSFLDWLSRETSIPTLMRGLRRWEWHTPSPLYQDLPNWPVATRQRVFQAFLLSSQYTDRLDEVMEASPEVSAALFAESPQWLTSRLGQQMLQQVLTPPAFVDTPREDLKRRARRRSLQRITMDRTLDASVLQPLLDTCRARWAAIQHAWPALPYQRSSLFSFMEGEGGLCGRADLLRWLKDDLLSLWDHPGLPAPARHEAAAIVCQIGEIETSVATDMTVAPPPPLEGPAVWRRLIQQQPLLMSTALLAQSPTLWHPGLRPVDLRPLLLHPDAAVREAGVRLLATFGETAPAMVAPGEETPLMTPRDSSPQPVMSPASATEARLAAPPTRRSARAL